MSFEQPRYWKNLNRHPLSSEYGDITGPEWQQFVATLKAKGIIANRRICLHEGKILDGWQLYRACVEADVKPIFMPLPKGVTAEEYVEIANDHRRHEDAGKRSARAEARRQRVAAARADGQSLRSISESENVSESQVRRDLGEPPVSGAPGGAPEIENSPKNETFSKIDGKNDEKNDPGETTGKTKGRDGKTYPAKSTADKAAARLARQKEKAAEKAAKAAERQPGDDTEIEAAAGEIVDADGKQVPDHAINAFQNAGRLLAIGREIDEIKALVREVHDMPGGRHIPVEDVMIHLKNAKACVVQSRATHVCPLCVGSDKACRCCKGEGWTMAHVAKRIAEEVKRK